MAKSRREQFEEQLRALQDDISQLSRRLGSPVVAGPVNSSSDVSAPDPVRKKVSVSEKGPGKSKGENARLLKEKRAVERERDELLFKVEQLHRENGELRQSLLDFQRVKSLFEHLKQDHDSLLVSLQSSERIRRQQKELIQILQKSGLGHDVSVDSTFSLSVHPGESCVDSSYGVGQTHPQCSSRTEYDSENTSRSNFAGTPPAATNSRNLGAYSPNVSISSQTSSTRRINTPSGRPPRPPQTRRTAVAPSLPKEHHTVHMTTVISKKRPKTASVVKSSAGKLSSISRNGRPSSATTSRKGISKKK